MTVPDVRPAHRRRRRRAVITVDDPRVANTSMAPHAGHGELGRALLEGELVTNTDTAVGAIGPGGQRLSTVPARPRTQS
jgi:hypothetical protein